MTKFKLQIKSKIHITKPHEEVWFFVKERGIEMIDSKNRVNVFVALTLLLFVSCTPRGGPAPLTGENQSPEEGAAAKAPVRETWEEEWDRTLRAAKNERLVVVYASSPAPALKEIITVVKKKFGLDLDIVSGTGPQLRGKILQERANGLYLADVLMSATNTTFGVIKPSGALDPWKDALILPEVLDPKVWYGGELPWLDKERMVFNYTSYPSSMIAVNNKLVNPRDIKSYYDLLDAKWKDKILMNDPTITGSAFNAFSSLLLNKILDLDFFRQLVSQQTHMLRDQRLQVDWVARGKYPIALWPRSGDVAEFQEAGAPIALVDVKEGTYLSEAIIALMNRSPHPNAARIFINWVLTREPQTMLQNYLQKQSGRLDVPADGLDQLKIRKPGEKYFMSANASEEWIVKEQQRYIEIARDIFGHLAAN